MKHQSDSKLDGRSWVSLFSSTDTGFYRQELPKTQRMLVRILYIILFAASVVMFCFASARRLSDNGVWYIVLPQVTSMVCMILALMALIAYVLMDCEMSAVDHNKSSFALKRAALWGSLFQVLSGAGVIAQITQFNGATTQSTLAVILFFLSAIPMNAIYWIERSILYTKIPDPTKELI